MPTSLLHQFQLQPLSSLHHQQYSIIGIRSAHLSSTEQKPSSSSANRTVQSCLTAAEVQPTKFDVIPRRSRRMHVQHLIEHIRAVHKKDRVEFLDRMVARRQDCSVGTGSSFDLNDLLMALVLAEEPDLALRTFSIVSVKGLLVPDSWTYSTLIRCHCMKGHLDEAQQVFDFMTESGFSPTVATVTELINSYCRKGGLKGAFAVFDSMGRIGISPTIQTYNCLIKGLCYVGRVEEALDMLKGIMNNGPVKPDIYTYTAVMDGFCKVGRSDEALELLKEAMEGGLSPNVVTYNTLFNGYTREGRPGKGLGVLRRMKERGCLPDCVSYRTLIHGLLKWGKARAALRVYREMEGSGFEVDERMMNVLVRGLCRASLKGSNANANATDLLEGACQLFGKMQSMDLAVDYNTYGLVVSSLSVGRRSEEALVNVERMVGEGLWPRMIDLEGVIKGLCKEGKIKKALSVLVLMEGGRYPRRRVPYNILVTEFNRIGMVSSACSVYGIALKRGVIPEKKPKLGRVVYL
ncbi:hypothetical protein SAY86_000389 [Trapa natans]|uniref:Pentatricopeptide repeat-containing protein n=1 Tax=Trapa natans TaxID=22666 RepID=A0AAN7RLD5_TRANT|nr:hypothetical protein SAY86_000389 [Trapa natans]